MRAIFVCIVAAASLSACGGEEGGIPLEKGLYQVSTTIDVMMDKAPAPKLRAQFPADTVETLCMTPRLRSDFQFANDQSIKDIGCAVEHSDINKGKIEARGSCSAYAEKLASGLESSTGIPLQVRGSWLHVAGRYDNQSIFSRVSIGNEFTGKGQEARMDIEIEQKTDKVGNC